MAGQRRDLGFEHIDARTKIGLHRWCLGNGMGASCDSTAPGFVLTKDSIVPTITWRSLTLSSRRPSRAATEFAALRLGG